LELDYLLHLPHLDKGLPVAARGENVASKSSSMASIYN
jgi:hypothetical protein